MSKNLDATLAALADPARRHVVELLRERPRRIRGGATVDADQEFQHAAAVSSVERGQQR